MKISERLFERVLNSVVPDADVSRDVAHRVLLSAFDSLGIEIEEPAHFRPVEYVWIERTWVDVREGDVIRPAGQATDEHAAEVVKIGPVNHWHAAPGASQYRPNESPLEWSARAVTLLPLKAPGGDADASTFTPPHGMRPDAPVDIRVTRGELAAIEACGGWKNRIGIISEAQEQGIVTS